jgi:hypothetical protein
MCIRIHFSWSWLLVGIDFAQQLPCICIHPFPFVMIGISWGDILPDFSVPGPAPDFSDPQDISPEASHWRTHYGDPHYPATGKQPPPK